jgi:hypothetical protein
VCICRNPYSSAATSSSVAGQDLTTHCGFAAGAPQPTIAVQVCCSALAVAGPCQQLRLRSPAATASTCCCTGCCLQPTPAPTSGCGCTLSGIQVHWRQQRGSAAAVVAAAAGVLRPAAPSGSGSSCAAGGHGQEFAAATAHTPCEVNRLLYALPLMMFSGEPVRLVLLLELYATSGG